MSSSYNNAYIVAPDQLDVGVETIRAGSNVSLTGTSANPIINAIVPIVALTAGSNITLSGTSNITINSVQGPSANNVPIPSSTPGTAVLQTITNTNQANYYTINNALFPQPAGGSNAYRFTFNAFFGAGTLTSGTGGIIDIFVGIGPTTQYLCGASLYASPTVSPVDNPFSMSALFIPSANDNLTILVRNNTGGTLSGLSLVPSSKGCGIELVSSNSAPQLIFS